jgi:hypothetical protein
MRVSAMQPDPYQLKTKTDAELHSWMLQQEHGSDAYIAGIKETMRRIAIVENIAQKRNPVTRRELIAIGIAAICLAGIIIVIMLTQ